MQKIKATLISNKGSSAIHGGRFKLPPLCERRGNERTTNTLINNEGKYTFLSTEGACNVLGLTNSRKAIENLDEDEKGVTIIYTLGGDQKVSIINEPGLYSLVLGSRKVD